jgi:ferredoxin
MSDEVAVIFVRGEERWSLKAKRGASLFKLARAQEIPVDTLCHGMGSCVRCKVRLVEGELSPPTAVERDKMGNIFHLTGERMACQVTLMSDVTLELSAPRKPRNKARRPPSRTS